MNLFDIVAPLTIEEAKTDYQKRRQRERDVDAGKPVSRQAKNPQTDYAKKRAEQKRQEALGEDSWHGEGDSWHGGDNAWSSDSHEMVEGRLSVGDPVIVTAPNEFEGKTGEISEFSPSGKFVIVNLYNHGKHSMHLSDVEYNEYADRQEDEVNEQQLDEATYRDVIYGLLDKFYADMKMPPRQNSHSGELEIKPPGTRVWTRGDGTRHRDPGYITASYFASDKKQAEKLATKFWPWLLKQPGVKSIGQVSGEFGSSPMKDAVAYKGLYFTNNNGYATSFGSLGRIKNPRSVWRHKPFELEPKAEQGADEVDEDTSTSPVTNAITRRILQQRLDLLKQYGPELVGAAVDNVADYVGDVEEIGSSDVSAWVAQVERMLKENPPEAFAEGWQDFNKVEPYAVCLAGKPVKKFDYYEEARKFHDNWKQKLYREGNKAKADTITLMPLNLDEAMSKNDLLNKLTKDLNSDEFKNTPRDPNYKGWTGPKPGDQNYTKNFGHGYPDVGSNRSHDRYVNKSLKKDVDEEQLEEAPARDVLLGLLDKFYADMKLPPRQNSHTGLLNIKSPGTRVWTRGDGTRHRDPGRIEVNYFTDDKKTSEKALVKFWPWLLKQPGVKSIGQISGEFGSSPMEDAVSYNGLYFTGGQYGVQFGSMSRVKNPKSVWRHKPFELEPKAEQGVAEDNLKEFAPGNGGGESGRWYADDQMTDLVGDGWWNDLDVSGAISKQEMIQEAQAWLDDQGYSVHVLNCKVNDDDMEWYIEGSFQNSRFAKKGVAEGEGIDPKIQFLQPTIQFAEKMGYKATLNPQGRVVAKLVNKQLGHIVHIGLMQPSGKGFEVSMADNLDKQTNAWSAKELAQDFKGWYAQAVKDQDFNNGYNEKPQLEQQGVAEGIMDELTPYELGEAEGLSGEYYENPYPEGSKSYAEYRQGWRDGTKQAEANRDVDETYTPSPAKPFRNPPGFNKQGTGVGNKLAQLSRDEIRTKIKNDIVASKFDAKSVKESYWTKLQDERNTKIASLIDELKESIKK